MPRPPRTVLTLVLLAATTLPTEIRPDQTEHVALPCVEAGPATQDADTADALNQQLSAKMRGYMNAYNTSCARAVVEAVRQRELNPRAAAIAIATVIVESSIANLDGGMLDSVGLYQQRASWGGFGERTNPDWATGKFLDVMRGFYPDGTWNAAAIGDVAAAVQRPAAKYRYRYGVEAEDAVRIVNELWPQDGEWPSGHRE